MNIAVVVPTVREDRWRVFKDAWADLFKKHGAYLITVWDGEVPRVTADFNGNVVNLSSEYEMQEIMGDSKHLIYNKNDGVRNLGFAFVAKYLKDVKYIVTLDDDVLPIGDTLQDHIDALEKRQPISYMNTAGADYMRGFPYWAREEAPVMLSHGVWEGVKDWDAPTQLVQGNKDVTFYKGPIPKGVYFPMCGMNIAFKRELLPYMYFAPMGERVGLDRFADIWLGYRIKNLLDDNKWAVVTGYAKVHHDRASNVWKNLQKEAKGLELNELFSSGTGTDHEYYVLYRDKLREWETFICRNSQ